MSAPFVPTGIDHIVIWVGNLEEARRWYTDVLGCRAGFEYPEIAMTHVWYGPVLLGLWDASDEKSAYAAPAVGTGENVHHIALAWQGAAEADVRSHLAAHGVEISKELRQVGSRGYGLALYFKDPWGNLIELKGPPEAV
ncbi:MAG: VOC family protein [Pseudomonadota bacterium]